MKLINPSAEFWPEPDDWKDQVARAARLCYAGDKNAARPNYALCNSLADRGHNSMFRHGSAYFYLSYQDGQRMPAFLYDRLKYSAFVTLFYRVRKDSLGNRTHLYFISTNMQYLMDFPKIAALLLPFRVSPAKFAAIALENGYPKALNLLRYTVCLSTQIATSRELNRSSPNAIAEQSTRFVNFGKRGGVTFVTPYWWKSVGTVKRLLARFGWKLSECFYNLWLRLGFPPEAARNFLMLEAATRVAYTYNVFEWQHILALRLIGSTGKPHPDAKIAAQLIHDAILPAMRILDPDASLIPSDRPSDP